MKSYPICLDVSGLACLVVGGGRVAQRKVMGLLDAGADNVTVVTPEASDKIEALAAEGKITLKKRKFRDEDLAGAALVFAAASTREVNEAVEAGAAKRKSWVNSADNPTGSTFHVPASLARGDLTIAASTSGSSPVLAAWIRDFVEARLPERIDLLAAVSSRIRKDFIEKGILISPLQFRILFDSGILDDFARSDWKSAEDKINMALGVKISLKKLEKEISTGKS